MTAAILALRARTFASVRKHRNYRLFFTGQVISLVGTWMQNIALAWYVIELTHSAVAVGVLAFCRFAPSRSSGSSRVSSRTGSTTGAWSWARKQPRWSSQLR
jgi:hypothetical protein